MIHVTLLLKRLESLIIDDADKVKILEELISCPAEGMQDQPRLVYTQAVQNFLFLIILGINLYLFLKFEVYYFTCVYHFNGSIV